MLAGAGARRSPRESQPLERRGGEPYRARHDLRRRRPRRRAPDEGERLERASQLVQRLVDSPPGRRAVAEETLDRQGRRLRRPQTGVGRRSSLDQPASPDQS